MCLAVRRIKSTRQRGIRFIGLIDESKKRSVIIAVIELTRVPRIPAIPQISADLDLPMISLCPRVFGPCVRFTGMNRKELKVVRLLEPDLCNECRFSHRATVEMADGSVQVMVQCRRLDCDNWDYATVQEPQNVTPEAA